MEDSIEELTQQLKKRAEAKPAARQKHGGDTTSLVLNLQVLEKLVTALTTTGSQPACARAKPHVEMACLELLKQGIPSCGAVLIGKALTALWGWLNTADLLSGFQNVAALLTDMRKKKPVFLATCHVLWVIFDSVVERGLEGTFGVKPLNGVAHQDPPIFDKLTDSECRAAYTETIARVFVTMKYGNGPLGQPLDNDRSLKIVAKAARDRDTTVRVAGFNGIAAGVGCTLAVGANTSTYDSLLQTSLKGLDDKHPKVREAAAEAVAEALFVSFRQHQQGDPEERGKRSGFLTIRRRKAAGGAIGADLTTLRNAVSRTFGSTGSTATRDATFLAVTKYLQKCATHATAQPKEVVAQLLSFLGIDSTGKHALAGAVEHEVLHSARCVSAIIIQWMALCPNEQTRVTVIRELAGKAAARPADRNRVEPTQVAAVLAIPDLLEQLGTPAIQQVYDEVVESMVAGGGEAGHKKAWVDTAIALQTLTRLLPENRPTLCQTLMALLIKHSGNALAGVGTPCDHEAVRCMSSAATQLLAVLSAEVTAENGVCASIPASVQLQLAELCQVAFPGPPYDTTHDTKDKDRKLAKGQPVPIDPQMLLELACLLESCLMCACGDLSKLGKMLTDLINKLQPVLKGNDPPTSLQGAIAAIRSRGSALGALVTSMRHLHNVCNGDPALLAQTIDVDLLTPILEECFEFLFHKALPAGDEKLEVLVCRSRSLLCCTTSMLPTSGRSPRASSLYIVATKGCVAPVDAMGAAQVASSIGPLLAPLPLYHAQLPPGLMPGVAQPTDANLDTTLVADTDWHQIIPPFDLVLPHPRRDNVDGPLLAERWRQPWVVLFMDHSLRCLGVVFDRQSKSNKKAIMKRLREKMQTSADKVKKDKGKSGTAERAMQLNLITAALVSLTCSAKFPGAEWGRDPDLVQVVSDALAMAKAVLTTPCTYTRAAAAEVVGLASRLAGHIEEDSFDAFLPQVVTKAAGAEAAALAGCVGALHAHDGSNRIDVLSLSVSYLQKLAQCDETDVKRGGDEGLAILPGVLSALSRVIESAGRTAVQYAEVAISFVMERLLVDKPPQDSSTGLNYDEMVWCGIGSFLSSLITALGPDIGGAPVPVRNAVKLLIHCCMHHTSPLPRQEGVRAIRALCATGPSPLPIDTPTLILEAAARLNGQLARCTPDAVLADCQLLELLFRRYPSKAADLFGPKQLLRLYELLYTLQSGSTRSALIFKCCLHVLHHILNDLQGDINRSRNRILEWVEICEGIITAKPRPVDEGKGMRDQEDDDDEDEGAVSQPTATPDAVYTPSSATKVAATECLAVLLQHLAQRSNAGEWLQRRFDTVIRACLVASDDRHSNLLRAAGLTALTSNVMLFQGVEDPKADKSYVDTTVDPMLRQHSILGGSLAQLTSAARQGLDRENPPKVRSGAAGLASVLLKSCVLHPQSAVKLLSSVISRFEEPNDEESQLGLARCICDVHEFFDAAHAARVKSGGGDVPQATSLPAEILSVLRKEATDGKPLLDKVRNYAKSALVKLGILTGMENNWALADPASEKPNRSLLPQLKTASPALLLAIASDASQGQLLIGTAVQVLLDLPPDDPNVGTVLHAVEVATAAKALEGNRSGAMGLASLLQNLTLALPQQTRGTALRCLINLSTMHQQAASHTIVAAIGVLAESDPVFSSLRPGVVARTGEPSSIPSDVFDALAVCAKPCGVASQVPLVFDVTVRCCSAVGYLPHASRACNTVLLSIATASGATPPLTATALHSFAHSLLKMKGECLTSQSFWHLLAVTACTSMVVATKDGHSEVGRMYNEINDLVTSTLVSGDGVVVADGLVAAVRQLCSTASDNEQFVSARIDVIVAALSAGAAAVTTDTPDPTGLQTVKAGAKVLMVALVDLDKLQLPTKGDHPLFDYIFAGGVAALSAGMQKGGQRVTPLGQCLLRVTKQFQGQFKALLPHLDPPVVSQLRDQLTAAAQSSNPGAAGKGASRPAVPTKLTINAGAFGR